MKDKIEKITGKAYWRSLDQLADTPEFREFLHREFPEGASEMRNPITRRNFLTLMGASLAMAGLAGCRKPVEKIIPYVIQPEEVIPGVAQHYATTMPFGTSAFGLVVESHEGRPTKIEGNNLHPASHGKSNTYIQAEILNMYDPDRSQKFMNDGAKTTWPEFVTFWQEHYTKFLETKGEGLAILSEQFSSPTLAGQRDRFMKLFPRAVFVAYDPLGEERVFEGCTMAGGDKTRLRPEFRYDKAAVILTLDADILQTENDSVSAAKRFADGRRITDDNDTMNRLYAVEADFSTTGAMADHRLRVARSKIPAFAAALALELSQLGVSLGLNIDTLKTMAGDSFDKKWLNVVARDLKDNAGKSVVVAGRSQRPEVHALVATINAALKNNGSTVLYREIRDDAVTDRKKLDRLISGMNDGSITALIMLGGNPAYNGPAGFAPAMAKVPTTIHLSLAVNETSQNVTWHIPRAHFLESWGDARAFDGSLSLIQPLIAPLFDGKSDIEFLDIVSGGRDRRGYDILREFWGTILKGKDFESTWRKVLHDGVLADSALPEKRLIIDLKMINSALAAMAHQLATTADGLEITLQPGQSILDGRFSNNGWMQELPHATSKLTWENAAVMSPATAKAHGLSNGEMIRLAHNGKDVVLPAWIVPGTAPDTITISYGYGRTHAGRVGNGVGVNIYPLRPESGDDYFIGATVEKTGDVREMATTQDHGAMEGRPLVREAARDEYRKDPTFAKSMFPLSDVPIEEKRLPSMYDDYDYSKGYQWGMTIDLTSCTGCNACTIACQSENNISVVGRQQVINGREMHWIRLDRYFSGDVDDPEVVFQPVTCQQCENAPCETVCPVAATVHDDEGLNVMTYNRCIGTRYCSNNCPYKVRRFNFFNYTKDTPEIVKMAMNPDVTVRSRGVMEKCTFCTQRINRAKLAAKLEEREVKDGEITTACQQACPTSAITFGNINDPKSRVSQIKKQNRNYELLAEYNLRTRLSYLARIRNPHPELAGYRPVEG